MTLIRTTSTLAALALISACAATDPFQSEPEVARFQQEVPPGADPNACWGKQVSPAVIETVTQQVLVQPAEIRADGTITRPAAYKTETVQKIVQEREENWFETPCEEELTEDFVASLQRALSVRGYYIWPVNGNMDARTRAAVRRYQKVQGLDSGILSLAAAQQLGLASVELASGEPAKILQSEPQQ
ncbi:MAG: peptidoglycan-binding protein [Paracoccaceae bacterium]